MNGAIVRKPGRGWVEQIDRCDGLAPCAKYTAEATWPAQRSPFLLTHAYADGCELVRLTLNGRTVRPAVLGRGVLVKPGDRLRMVIVNASSAPIDTMLAIVYRHPPLAAPLSMQLARAASLLLVALALGFIAVQVIGARQ